MGIFFFNRPYKYICNVRQFVSGEAPGVYRCWGFNRAVSQTIIVYQNCIFERTTAAFREIGIGLIGKVFEHPGCIWVYKLRLTDDVFKLWNDYTMNQRIENSFEYSGPWLVKSIFHVEPVTCKPVLLNSGMQTLINFH